MPGRTIGTFAKAFSDITKKYPSTKSTIIKLKDLDETFYDSSLECPYSMVCFIFNNLNSFIKGCTDDLNDTRLLTEYLILESKYLLQYVDQSVSNYNEIYVLQLLLIEQLLIYFPYKDIKTKQNFYALKNKIMQVIPQDKSLGG